MKAVAKLGKAFGGLVLLVATMALITAMSLFVVGGFLATWPILRLSPRGQRKQAVVNLGVALMATYIAFQGGQLNDDEYDDAL